MVPRYIEFTNAMSRTPTGKPQKAALRQTGITENTWDRKAAGLSLAQITQENHSNNPTQRSNR
jgi:crotonobetaine/carnitine-CoA ligase